MFFSTYVWNSNLSSEIAKKIKIKNPETTIIFGGCQVPRRDTKLFMANNPYLDIACSGEGEKVFKSILENFPEKNWENVPSITYNSRKGKIITNPNNGRILDLKEIPSPYLSGVFDKIMKKNPDETWIGLWETNRGCPFGCSYCEWGGDYYKQLIHHDLEKLVQEVDWFSKNKVEFIFCCDSNFGITERDLEISKKIANNKQKYGYPKAFSVQNTKNSTIRSYDIQKILGGAGLSKGVNLAFQSLNKNTLVAVGRKNISNETFNQLQSKFNSEGIETFSDIILGLPEETYESFVDGLEVLIENGQKNRIQINNLSLLHNSEMGAVEYQKKYRIQFVENTLINVHGSLGGNEIEEKQKMVTGTNTMPPEKWVEARSYGWMLSLLYFDKLLQIPFTVLRNNYDVKYKEIINYFLNSDVKTSPIISNIGGFFRERAKAIQTGSSEFCESKEWLNIWWPADELSIIKLFTNDQINEFYSESKSLIKSFLNYKNIEFEEKIIDESVKLNNYLMKRPFQKENLVLNLNYNIWEFYHSDSIKKPIPLKKNESKYLINRTGEVYNSWEDWCQKVIWYGNKRGAYIYPCEVLEK